MLREVEDEGRKQFTPTAMPISPQTRRRRSSGCCGCGCLSTVFTLVIALIIIGAVGLGIYASSNPEGAAAFLSDPAKAVNNLINQLKSGSVLGSPQFTSYSAPPTTAHNGSIVPLHWSTNGAEVRLETLNRVGTISQTISLASSGTSLIPVQGTPGDVLSYRLVASLNGQTTNRSFTITVTR